MLQDFSKISKATGIPVGRIRRVIGSSLGPQGHEVPIPPISTFREAQILSDAEDSDASTVDDARKEYYRAPHESPAKRAALQKWILLCATPEEISEAYYETEDESNEEMVASSRLTHIFSMKLEGMSSLKEIRELYEETPVGHPAEKVAILKMCEVCGHTD